MMCGGILEELIVEIGYRRWLDFGGNVSVEEEDVDFAAMPESPVLICSGLVHIVRVAVREIERLRRLFDVVEENLRRIPIRWRQSDPLPIVAVGNARNVISLGLSDRRTILVVFWAHPDTGTGEHGRLSQLGKVAAVHKRTIKVGGQRSLIVISAV